MQLRSQAQENRHKLTDAAVVTCVFLRDVDASDPGIAPHLPAAVRAVTGPIERAGNDQQLVVRTDGRVSVPDNLDHTEAPNGGAARRVGKIGACLKRRISVLWQLSSGGPRSPPRDAVDIAVERPGRRHDFDGVRVWHRRRGRPNLLV